MADHREEVIAAKGLPLVIADMQNMLRVCVPNGLSDGQLAITINSFPWRNTPGPWHVEAFDGECPDFKHTRHHVLLTC